MINLVKFGQFDPRVARYILNHLDAWGVTRVVFPPHEYRSENAGSPPRNAGPVFDTVRIMPRGDDGGFAERFLRNRRKRRDT